MKYKLVKIFTTQCKYSNTGLLALALVFFVSCTGEAEFEPDTSTDVSKTDTNDMGTPDVTKKDTTQSECEPLCEAGEVCKTDSFVCVDCLGDSDCTSGRTNQICDTDTNTCVDCKDNSLCTDAAASTCSTGTCGACVMDSDCAHIAGLPRCDAGECKIECETDAHCDGKVCDVVTNTCTAIDPGTSGQCESCVSDTQCASTHHCVPLGFGSPDPAPRGNYCLEILGNGACSKPYRVDIDRESLNGAVAESHCGVNEELTTCEAMLSAIADTECKDANADMADLSKCPSDAGARCEKLLGNWTCTYECDGDEQCQSSKNCTGGYCK